MGEQRERRLISEWRQERHPRDAHILECNLGAVPADLVNDYGLTKAAKAIKPWRLVVDCLVILQDRLVLAEAKVFRPRDGVGDLLVYKPMVAVTPELVAYKDLPIELVLVIPYGTPQVVELCQQSGITLDVFDPPWVADYMVEHGKYWTREYQAKRAERNRVRQALGVE